MRARIIRQEDRIENSETAPPEPRCLDCAPVLGTEDGLAVGAEGKAPTKCGQWTSRVGGDGEKQAGVNP